MSDFKYGDKAVHDAWGNGTVLNVFPHVKLVQFWPDSNRPNGPTYDVHPVSLTRLLTAADIEPQKFYVEYEGECESLDVTTTKDAVLKFISEHLPEGHKAALKYRPLMGKHISLASYDGADLSYHVHEGFIDQWLEILPLVR